MAKVLSNGPWFINGFHFLVQKWEPHFVASEAKQLKSAVWIRLPQLPTEFYDSTILQKIGNKIEKLLRIDACTSSALRGRYARLCVEVSMESPVKPFVYIGNYKQQIQYEGENFLYKNCGRLGHNQTQCSVTLQNTNSQKQQVNKITTTQQGVQSDCVTTTQQGIQSDWVTVTFNKKKHAGSKAIPKAKVSNPGKRSNINDLDSVTFQLYTVDFRTAVRETQGIMSLSFSFVKELSPHLTLGPLGPVDLPG
uniref:DUF4283 domain-containing protein n=1 Tax=Nicotiana tabacum TaxID=4097 RepID=A0A1S4D1V9_TOBAC|nr:PREDICTED: uncharacterized protein LOC107825104 [Nicotiana tabacum]